MPAGFYRPIPRPVSRSSRDRRWTWSYAEPSTPKSGTDASDAGSDASALTVNLPQVDTGSAADASALAAVYATTDTGTGTDTSALATAITATDSGAGTEASAVAQSKEGTDTGSGAEVSVLEASFLLTDTGAGAEASVVDQTKDAVDSGAGSDASTLAAAYALTDTGAGTEVGSVEQREDKVGTDTGKGAEGNAPVFTDYDVPDLDSSTNATSYATPSWTPPTSGLALVFISARANTGSGAPPDSVTGNGVTWVNVASAPTGTRSFDLYAANLSGATAGAVTIDFGADVQNYCTALFSVVSDADLSGGVAAAFAQAVTATGATGTPSFLMAPASSPVNRAVAGFIHGANEATTPKGTWTELDDSSGSADNRGTEVSYFPDWFDAEVSATWATTSVTWIAIAVEVKGLGSEYVDAAIPLTDSGSGADASTLAAVLSATEDTGSGTDTGAFAAAYAVTDTGTGADSATVGVAALSATDTGTGDDVSTLVAVYAVTDTGSGADASALVADLAAVDSGAGTDASSLLTEDPNKVSTDAGTGAEASALAVDLPQVDSGSAADASTLTAVYAATDTGSGAEASTLDQAYIATDTGAGAEEAVVLAVAIPVTETGTGTDASALVADLAATDSGTDSEAGSVDTGTILKAGTDSGSGSEIVGEFARVLFDRVRAQTSKFGYGSYNVPPQRGWWVPAGNDDWSGIGTDQYLDYPKAFQDDVPYDTYKATATVSPFGVTDNVVATYFPGLYDNWSPEYITYASPNDVPVYIVFDIGTVASQSGCTIEARLTRNGVSFGNYISKAIPNGTGGVVLEADVNGSGWYGGTPWASSGTVISGGDLADPQFGIEFYVYSNRGTSTTVDITRITCNTQVLTPPVVSTGGGQGAVGEQGALNYASSDTGTGSDSSTLQVTHNRTDQCSSAEGEQWSNLEIGAHGYDDGTASEVASIANSVAVVESLVGVDASLLEALIGGTETGSSTDAAGGLGLATTDVGTGVESLGARTFGASELISVLDVGDANWWLIGAPTDNTLALTATSVGTESLTPSTAGTQTLTPASTVTEVLTTANTDTSLVLNPIDYEPQ